jgi:spermidine synthase
VIPTIEIDRAATPGGEMVLSRHGDDFAIRVGGVELMSSRAHGSEDQLGAMTAERIAAVTAPRVLVGGLGLGYTLRALLDGLPARAYVEVVELVPAIVRWSREHVGHLAGRPLDDRRVVVREGDVAAAIRRPAAPWDAVVLDVDNGPDALFAGNAGLYRRRGLEAAREALAPGGVLAVWSAFQAPGFTRALAGAGFGVEEVTVRARGARGARHTLWFARSGAGGDERARDRAAPRPPEPPRGAGRSAPRRRR